MRKIFNLVSAVFSLILVIATLFCSKEYLLSLFNNNIKGFLVIFIVTWFSILENIFSLNKNK